jgi:hypothetical protein
LNYSNHKPNSLVFRVFLRKFTLTQTKTMFHDATIWIAIGTIVSIVLVIFLAFTAEKRRNG